MRTIKMGERFFNDLKDMVFKNENERYTLHYYNGKVLRYFDKDLNKKIVLIMEKKND